MIKNKGKKGPAKKSKPPVNPDAEKEAQSKEVEELYYNTVGSWLMRQREEKRNQAHVLPGKGVSQV